MPILRLWVATLLLALPFTAQPAEKMVRVVVPYGSGDLDNLGRMFTQQLAATLKETWIVENMAGANGTIGVNHVARARPDGRTLLFTSNGQYVAPLVTRNVPYDPVKDFVPIAAVVTSPLVLVVNPQKVKANNLTELVAAMKAAPGEYTFAHAGLGTSPHMVAVAFQQRAGVTGMLVPYKSTGAATADVIAGHVSMMFLTPLLSTQLVSAGRLKALAITSPQRLEVAADLPTMSEAGLPGFVVNNAYGYWAPKGLPADELARLSEAMRTVSQDAGLRGRLAALGMAPVWQPPEEFAQYIEKEYANSKALLDKAGVKPE